MITSVINELEGRSDELRQEIKDMVSTAINRIQDMVQSKLDSYQEQSL